MRSICVNCSTESPNGSGATRHAMRSCSFSTRKSPGGIAASTCRARSRAVRSGMVDVQDKRNLYRQPSGIFAELYAMYRRRMIVLNAFTSNSVSLYLMMTAPGVSSAESIDAELGVTWRVR